MTTYYQNSTSTGRRVNTELAALIPPVVATEDLDLLNSNKSAFGYFVGMNDLSDTIKPVGDYTYLVHEDSHPSITVLTTSAYTAGSGNSYTFTVPSADTKLFVPWSTWYDKTNDVHFWVASESSGTITVYFNHDGSGTAAGASGSELIFTGMMNEEGTGVPNMLSTEPTEYTNYIRKMLTPVTFTWDAATSKGRRPDRYYQPDDEKYQWAKRAPEALEGWDLAAMFGGKPALVTSSTANPAMTAPTAKGNKAPNTAGFLWWHETYADSDHFLTNADVTENEFIDIKAAAFTVDRQAGSDHKICLCPMDLLTGVQKWNLSKQRFWSDSKMKGSKDAYVPGISFSRYEGPEGIIDFVRYYPFETIVSGGWQWFVILDKKRIGFTRYKGMPKVDIQRDVIQNGDQITAGYYEYMCGTVFRQPNVHVTCKFQTVS